MTFREKLEDWISGGKISELTLSKTTLEANYMSASNYLQGMIEASLEYADAIQGILDHVSPQKSGTAKKVARMCREALGE